MEKRKLNRRDFLRLSAAAATGAIAAACAPAAPQVIEVEKEVPVEKVVVETVEVEKVVRETVVVEKEVIREAKPAQKVRLRWLCRHLAMPEEGKRAWEQAYPIFQEKHPNIEVQYLPTPPDFVNKIVAAVVAGNAPDLFGLC